MFIVLQTIKLLKDIFIFVILLACKLFHGVGDRQRVLIFS